MSVRVQPPPRTAGRPIRLAILSFLFNWPSTGGGIIHTVELAQFLSRAGYDVRHFYARYERWQIGRVDGQVPFPGELLPFEPNEWSVETIKARFRTAVEDFDPDAVIITDCWNFKPHLADAVRGFPYLLRMQAAECLCPLNNLRLLPAEHGGVRYCLTHQFASPDACRECVAQRSRWSGPLHRAERELSGVGTPEYEDLLRRAFREAEAVLVLNHATARLLDQYATNVQVVTWGMDEARFPWPPQNGPTQLEPPRRIRLLFAGAVWEAIKGFGELHAACAQLWSRRQDFELIATGEPAGAVDEFTRFVGWASQADLPHFYREAGMVIVPTIAAEGLSRTAAEAMASGRPVIGSRIGGLLDQIIEGENGLFAAPGNADDLAARIEDLLDRPELRRRMGLAGRWRFERDYTWPVVIERDYRPLLEQCARKRARCKPKRDASLRHLAGTAATIG